MPQPPQALAESELTAENLTKTSYYDTDYANNMSDNQYLQTSETFSYFINNIQGPDDLVLLQSGKAKGWHGKEIVDVDGDGVEDVQSLSADDLDKFYDPLVMGVAEDVPNTTHGNLPGFQNAWAVPKDFHIHNANLVRDSWKTS